jgi:hypothetical protein
MGVRGSRCIVLPPRAWQIAPPKIFRQVDHLTLGDQGSSDLAHIALDPPDLALELTPQGADHMRHDIGEELVLVGVVEQPWQTPSRQRPRRLSRARVL